MVATVGFQAFLYRLLTGSTLEKSRKYDVYSRKSERGYDYYQSFRRACKSTFLNDEDYSEVAARILKLKNSTEREDNASCFDAAVAYVKSDGGKTFQPPRGFIFTPQKLARIRLQPDTGLGEGNSRRIISFWTIKGTRLTPRGAGVGLYLLQSELKKGSYANCNFLLIDLMRKKVFDQACIPNDAARVLRAELAQVDSFFE